MRKKVKEILPEMTLESEVSVKKLRKTVYETEAVSIKRIFYTHLGIASEFGPKSLYNNDNQSTNSFNGSLPFSQIDFGLTLRYWDFRLDIFFPFPASPAMTITKISPAHVFRRPDTSIFRFPITCPGLIIAGP